SLFIQNLKFLVAEYRCRFLRAIQVKFELTDLAGLKGKWPENSASAGDFRIVPFFQLKGEAAAARKPGADFPRAMRCGRNGRFGEVDLRDAVDGNLQRRLAHGQADLAAADAGDFSGS